MGNSKFSQGIMNLDLQYEDRKWTLPEDDPMF